MHHVGIATGMKDRIEADDPYCLYQGAKSAEQPGDLRTDREEQQEFLASRRYQLQDSLQ